MTTGCSPAEVDQLCKRMQAWEDDAVSRDGTCVKCGEPIGGKEPEHEPSPLCNACAQDLATRAFPGQLEAARGKCERLQADRDDLAKDYRRAVAERDAARADLSRLHSELDTAVSARALAESRANNLDASHRARDATKLRIAARLGLPATATQDEIADAVDAVVAELDRGKVRL